MVGMSTTTDTLQLTLGETLRLMRERAGYNQRQLADMIELSRNSVVNYENDIHTPKWMVVAAWAQACGFDPAVSRESWEIARLSGWTPGGPPPDDGRYLQLSWVGEVHGGDDSSAVPTSGVAA
jgi:DNA-binding XRE family transcriptional regulator